MKIKKRLSNDNLSSGANEVVIYNFLVLITIDTNINQFIYRITDYLKKFKQFIKNVLQ